tara:strand:+ start:274 stop:1284 length:1011 start_codon:yes stop_codon:yes gene_type:complete
MRDLYNLHNVFNNGKGSKKLNNRGKSFGYQVLGFGAGAPGVGTFLPNQKGIFVLGDPGGQISNLISNTGVVASDTAIVAFARNGTAGASYGEDKALIGYGHKSGAYRNISNLISNTGVVAADVTIAAGTARYNLGAATYGGDKAIFGYGMVYPTDLSMTNLVTNVGVVGADVTGVGTARTAIAATGYGPNRQTMLFGYGNINTGTYVSMTNLVSNTGVVATDTTGVGTIRHGLGANTYGEDKALFGYGTNGSNLSMTNLVSSVGVVATDTVGVGTARHWVSASVYGGDKSIFGGGTLIYPTAITNLVSNVGVVATDTAGAAGVTARANYSATGYSV